MFRTDKLGIADKVCLQFTENSMMAPPSKVSLEEEHYHRHRDELPYDVVIEILIRLPIRTCLQCKCVCKIWYNLIMSKYFMVKHQTDFKDSNHKKNEFSISCHSFVPNGASTTVSFHFFDVPIDLTIPVLVDRLEVVGCSNGLICLSLSLWREGFVICNPATKQCRQIAGDYPIIYKRGYYSCGFYFNKAANTFKVARIAISGSDIQVNMFTSKANSWSSKELTVDHGIFFSSTMRNVTCVESHMYWDSYIGYGGDKDILCFDMVDESFCFIQLPYYKCGDTRLGSHKGSLALLVRVLTGSNCPIGFEVWTMNNRCGSNEWSKQIVCRPSEKVGYAEGVLSKDEIDLVVVSNGSGECFLCDPETGATKKLQGTRNVPPNFFIYGESFASVY